MDSPGGLLVGNSRRSDQLTTIPPSTRATLPNGQVVVTSARPGNRNVMVIPGAAKYDKNAYH